MRKTITLTVATALTALALVGPASALAAPVLDISSMHQPAAGSSVPAGSYAGYELTVSNAGDAETSEPVAVEFSVPAGLEITKVSVKVTKFFGFEFTGWSCSKAPDSLSATCSGPEVEGFGAFPIEAGKEACAEPFLGIVILNCRVFITLKADPGATPGIVHPTIEACGGGAAACASTDDPIEIGPPPEFEITHFDGRALRSNGDPATQAGSHPQTASTDFAASTVLTASVGDFGPLTPEYPVEDLKDVIVKLPPGIVGNPQALPTCSQAQLLGSFSGQFSCPIKSQVGVAQLDFSDVGTPLGNGKAPIYNMETGPGTPGLLAFNYANVLVQVYVKVRTGEDYGVTAIAKNAAETLPIKGVEFTVWGVPADHGNDPDRMCFPPQSPGGDFGCASPEAGNPKPFFTLPTSCEGPGPNNSVETSLELLSWLGGSDSASFLSHDNEGNPIGADGCNALDFSPTLEARPTTNVADAPSGLDVDLRVPQNEDPEGTAEAHLRDTTVTLPEGLVINPSGANGLGGCSLAQFGFTSKEGEVIHTTPDPAICPDNSKLGTVQVDSPLVDHPLNGAVYIANPHANPFNSLLAIYITIDDPQTGVVVKLAGKVSADPVTGRLTTTVTENPQLPFEDFKLHFFGGAGGALRTPAVCGGYATTSSLTPWSAPESGPPATPSDTWAITRSPGGGACPASDGTRPNTPDLDAGTISPIAGSFSPLVINLRREDGSQQFGTVTLTPPPGLLARLAGTPYCSEAALAAAASKSGQAENASPSCPAGSAVGTVDVAAGAGPAPYHAQGTAYLTGPYKGAPLSLAILTPATAGPFDLGTVVVRTALQVDPATARVTAVSDPIPSILQGIPLDVRNAQIKLDKPSFTLNPTSCDPLSFSGSLLSALGQSAPLTERFQVGECGRLKFAPKLGFRLIGGTKRGAHPALTATLTMPEGGANVAKASVALPHSEFLDQAHIGTVCTRVQYAADQCPAASVYGSATAFSPLLDAPLSGPVYLRSSDNKLPDLVTSLDGQIHVDLVGRIDSVNGGIRTTFEGVPDAPVTKFVLQMQGARKGLLQNSTNICKGKHLATAEFEAQNGKVSDFSPSLRAQCKKSRKGNKRHSRGQRRAVR